MTYIIDTCIIFHSSTPNTAIVSMDLLWHYSRHIRTHAVVEAIRQLKQQDHHAQIPFKKVEDAFKRFKIGGDYFESVKRGRAQPRGLCVAGVVFRCSKRNKYDLEITLQPPKRLATSSS